MDTMHEFKKSVYSLKDIDLSIAIKLQKYSNLKEVLPVKLTQEGAVKNEDTLRCLFDCIKADVVSESLDLRRSVLTILDLLCKSPWMHFIAQDLTDVCIHLTFEDATKDTDDVQTVTLKCLECVLQQLILENDCDPETVLLKVSKDTARKKIIELFEKICKDLPSQLSLFLFYEKIVTAIFKTSDVDIRACLAEFAVVSLPQHENSLLGFNEQKKFRKCTTEMYVDKTVKFLEAGDRSWDKIWILLVRWLGKTLHGHSDILNALLKVIEAAFRSKQMTNTSAAYDCWKELISVYSLNLEQMCSPKYMKLLMLPLKNNKFKNGNLTRKRFELWAHLINILQEKSFESCLRQFLEFCFGPLGENPLISCGNASIGSPARTDPEVWQGSTRALLELMGHQNHEVDSCLGCTDNSLLKLEKPLITHKNFMVLDYILINSVGECCTLILNRMNQESTNNLNIKTITCIWESLFCIINQLEKIDQENAIRRVTALLAVFVQLSNETPAYFDYLLKPVFELLVNKKCFSMDIQRVNTQLIFPLLKKFFKRNDIVFLGGKDTILQLLRYSKNTHDKNSWLEETYEVFLKSDPKRSNIIGLLFLWVDCADVLNNVCEFPTRQTEKVVQGVGIGFMLWPVLNMFRLSLETPIIAVVAQTWGNTFANMLKTYTKDSLTILIALEKEVDSSPALACYVAQLVPGFLPLLDTEPNHKFVMTVLNLMATLLGVPTLTRDTIKSLLLPNLLLIMKYFNMETDKTSKYSDFQHLCQCFEYLLHLHKEYTVLDAMESFFLKLDKTFQENVPQSLRAVFNSLKAHPNNNISQKARNVSSKFIKCAVESTSKADETFLQPKFTQLSRAAKITNMAIATPKSPAADIPAGTTMLRLLGHQIETSSPVRVRGSQLSNSDISRKRKATNILPEFKKSIVRVDDEEANFVLIEDQYQFDPSKLSEHQMEVMKRRRPDIPALYQDLSQSQSNSQSVIQKFANGQNKAEEEPELRALSNHNNDSVDQEIETITSEVLFHTEDAVTTNALMTSSASEKKGNYVNNRNKGENEGDSPSFLNQLVNSKAHNADEPEINRTLSIQPAALETEKTKEASMPKRGRPRSLKSKKLLKAASAKAIEGSNTDDTALLSNESHLEAKSDVSAIKNSKNDVNLEDSCSARIDLKIQNPSMKQIEAMIAEDSLSNHNPGFASMIFKQHECTLLNINENKPGSVNEENKNQDGLSDEEKRKQKVTSELNKLKMDIVGGDAFVRNLNLTERVRTRRSVDVTALSLRSGSRINYDSDDSKSSTSSESSRKSKLRATVKIVEKLAKDKLCLSPKSNGRIRQAATPSSPKTNPKLSPVQDKNINLEIEKNNTSANKPIKRRRRSSLSGVKEIAHSGEENMNPRTRRSKSATPEKRSPVEENMKKRTRSDKNWIAKVNESLAECAKHSKAGARKSLAAALESASSDNQSMVATKAKRGRLEAESKIVGSSEFTVTLFNNAESQHSEDIIESSQESSIEIRPCRNIDSPLENIRKSIDLEIEEVLTHLKKRKVHTVDTVGVVRADPELVAPIDNCSVTTDELSFQDAMDKLSPFNSDELIHIDFPSLTKPTHSNNDTAEMDTLTLEMLSDTPTKKSLSIPTSPVGSDTPNRTSELISNTINISPIKLVPQMLNTESNSEKITPDLFGSEPCTSNKISTPKPESDAKSSSPPKSNINYDSAQDTLYQEPGCSAIPDQTNQRSLKLLRMIPHTPPLGNYTIQKAKQTSKPFISSPKTHRIQKMMHTFEQKSESEDVQEIVELDLDEEPVKGIQEKDILKFVKELPSPMASPRYSILKRKAPDVRDEGLSPPRKKRVNFSDPPTTCEKVFFKDKNEHFHGKKDEYSEDAAYTNNANVQQLENISTSSTNTEPPVLEPMEYIEPPILEPVKNTEVLINNREPPHLEEILSEKETESLDIETQGSVDVTNPHELKCNQPILPEYVNCQESIDCIVGKLTRPIFTLNLIDELHKRNIVTVGDLAKLSEIEVARLPFKSPKLLVVRTNLKKFMSQKSAGNVHVTSRTNQCTVDKSAMNECKLDFNFEEKSSEEEQEVNTVLMDDKEKPKPFAGNLQDSVLLSPTSKPKVTLVSSVVLKPARTVAQNATNRSPRRVPLVKVTSSSAPTCSTFVELEPIITAKVEPETTTKVEPAATARIEPSNSKESDCSNRVVFGNAEEREKLRTRIPEIIADFQEMREKVKRQGLSATSLYELIIEIVGAEEFVSILQGNKALIEEPKFSDTSQATDIVKCIPEVKKVELMCKMADELPSEQQRKLGLSMFDKMSTKEAYECWTNYFSKRL